MGEGPAYHGLILEIARIPSGDVASGAGLVRLGSGAAIATREGGGRLINGTGKDGLREAQGHKEGSDGSLELHFEVVGIGNQR